MIESLHEIQTKIEEFEITRGLHKKTMWERFKRVSDEFHELGEEIRYKTEDSDRKIAEEAVDCIIGLIGIIGFVNGDFEELLNKKIEIIERKYGLEEYTKLRRNGHSVDETINYQKQRWIDLTE